MRRRTRGRARLGLERAGIGGWGWTLFVACLCVLVWELPFFRATGEACGCPIRDYELPRALNGMDLELAPMLTVPRAGAPRLDGRRIDDAAELVRDLEALRGSWDLLHPREPFPGSLLLAADRRTRWGALRPLLAAAARAGYARPQLAVEIEDGEAGTVDWDRFRAPEDVTQPR